MVLLSDDGIETCAARYESLVTAKGIFYAKDKPVSQAPDHFLVNLRLSDNIYRIYRAYWPTGRRP